MNPKAAERLAAGARAPRADFGSDAGEALQRVIDQWQFRAGPSLSRPDLHAFGGGRDRGSAGGLRAAVHLQLGDDTAAWECIRLARESGCEKQVLLKILVSGVHNTLGRISALLQQEQGVASHFGEAIALSPFSCDRALFERARTHAQYSQLGATVPLTLPQASHGSEGQSTTINVQQIAAFNLGDAWSANTINTVIFRHHGVMTWNNLQYTAFYIDKSTLRIVQRDLRNDAIKTFDLPGEYNLRDAHNSISLGADRTGHIHISYDHHASRLRYRRSKLPHSILEWSEELAMTGHNEESVTYPTFILPRKDFPLTILYRDGIHNKGSARIKTYDEDTELWLDAPKPILSGADQKPWTSNAYWNNPVIGPDGSLHISFVWRGDALGEDQLLNNSGLGYAWSPDNGLSWFSSLGRPYKLPITQVNAESIWSVPPGSNLINQTSMALDSHGRPHIAFYSNDEDGVPQYQHIWFTGKAWKHQFISSRSAPFTLKGGGTLQIPISRPEMVIGRSDEVYMIYRGDLTGNRMSITLLNSQSPQLFARPRNESLPVALWSEAVGFAEPILDRGRWAQSGVLTLLIQHNDQPDGDKVEQAQMATVWLVDVCIDSNLQLCKS